MRCLYAGCPRAATSVATVDSAETKSRAAEGVPFGEWRGHLETCVCRPVKCSHCNASVLARDLQEHERDACVVRLTSCPLYPAAGIRLNMLEQHKSVCEGEPNDCGTSLLLVRLLHFSPTPLLPPHSLSPHPRRPFPLLPLAPPPSLPSASPPSVRSSSSFLSQQAASLRLSASSASGGRAPLRPGLVSPRRTDGAQSQVCVGAGVVSGCVWRKARSGDV